MAKNTPKARKKRQAPIEPMHSSEAESRLKAKLDRASKATHFIEVPLAGSTPSPGEWAAIHDVERALVARGIVVDGHFEGDDGFLIQVEGPGTEQALAARADKIARASFRSTGISAFRVVETTTFAAGSVAGFVAAPRLNAKFEARPLGSYVPPSAAAALAAFVAGALARRARWRKTAAAGFGLGAGLALGTVASAKQEGGLLQPRKGA